MLFRSNPCDGKIREIEKQLKFSMFPSQGLVWCEDGEPAHWSDNPLFDNWIEAFHFSEKAVSDEMKVKLKDCGELIVHLRRLLHSYLINNIGYREQVEYWVTKCDEILARMGGKATKEHDGNGRQDESRST